MTRTDSRGDRGPDAATGVGDESATGETPTVHAGSTRRVAFSRAGARRGFRDCLPIAVGVAGYGVVFGVLASEAGLSVAEAALMSATVLAGAAQLLAVELWTSASVTAIVLATAAVNLRYLLLGAALRPWFADRSALETYGSAFFVADENWALTMRAFADADGDAGDADGGGSADAAYLLGSGLAIWVLWVAATVVGALAGDGIGDPARYGLDTVFVAVFIAIAVDLWDGRADLLPWTAAFVAALATAAVAPGRWYLLAGALSGCSVGVYRADSAADSSGVSG